MARRALICAAMWLLSSLAVGAEVTHVATAASEQWPIEIDLSAGFVGTIETADIARQEFQTNPQGITNQVLANELSYRRTTMSIPLRAAIGIWRNLELHVLVPIVVSDDQRWQASDGTAGTVSQPAGICPEGPTPPGVPCASGVLPNSSPNTLVPYPLPVHSNRGGFAIGDVSVGFAWDALREEDSPSFPTWLIGFDYVAPNAPVMNPTKVSYQNGNPTQSSVGDGLHHFHPYSALSKRKGPWDPYLSLWLDFAHTNGASYDNCSNPYPNSGNDSRPNCHTADFPVTATRIQPEAQAGVWFGTEIVPYENPSTLSKFSLDLRVIAEFHSDARTYTQLSDLLQVLTEQQDYARLGGAVGFAIHGSKYFRLLVNFTLEHDTDHWLTAESLSNDVNTASHANQNPNYDFRYDSPGARFRLQNSLIGTLSADVMVSF